MPTCFGAPGRLLAHGGAASGDLLIAELQVRFFAKIERGGCRGTIVIHGTDMPGAIGVIRGGCPFHGASFTGCDRTAGKLTPGLTVFRGFDMLNRGLPTYS